MMLLGSLIVLSSISVIVNIFLIWYAYNAVKQIRVDQIQIYNLIEELEELQRIVSEYVTHLQSVEELEIFYGDETLRHLMRHGQAVIDTFREYHHLYSPILNKEENTNYERLKETSAPEGQEI